MSEGKGSVVKKLIASCKDDDFFQDQMGVPYVAIDYKGVRQILPLRGKGYKNLLVARTYDSSDELPSLTVLNGVLAKYEAQAVFDGRRVRLENRFAHRGETLWFDLSDKQWRAVKITGDGWQIVKPHKYLFRRYTHQQRVPVPERGGDVRKLFEFLNVGSNEQYLLVLGWLGCMFIPDIPRPILCISGPQQSAKTTRAKMLRYLADPSALETVSLPKNSRELAQILEHHAVRFSIT